MTRLFIRTELAVHDEVAVTGQAAHYLLNVLRSAPGDGFLAIDASGGTYEVRIERCERETVHGRVVAAREADTGPHFGLEIHQALLKARKFELVIQKCTELGVARIVPVVTERTVIRIAPDRLEHRLKRWRAIAEEACRQCGRTRVPQIAYPTQWAEALVGWQSSGAPGLMPYEALAGSSEHSLGQALSRLKQTRCLSVFIGPEGGFSADEAEQAHRSGVEPVSLGPRTLRAETAAIAACAIVMYELADQ